MSVHHLHNQAGARPAEAPIGWGAAIIDDKGNEVPITEAMVQRACDELARSWLFPRHEAVPAR